MALAILVYALLATLWAAPVVFYPHERVFNLGDPLHLAWVMAWDAHQLVRDPLGLFDSNAFFPYGRSLTFSDHLLPEALLAAHEQYYQYAKQDIERGKEVLERGFMDFPSSEIRIVQREAREEKKIELRKMSKGDFNQVCGSQAGKFQRLVSGKFDKSAGYQKNAAGSKQGN